MSGVWRVVGLGCALALCVCGNAFGLSGSRVLVGTPGSSGPPSVAVDANGTAYIAWANTKDQAPHTTNVVDYCVIPASAHGCAVTGTLAPADGIQYIDGVHVLIDGNTVVILADVFGNTPGFQDYQPLQEWQSTNGGAAFTPVIGGKSVAEGLRGSTTQALGAVVVPGTNELGFGWDTPDGPPSFHAFPLSSPPECSQATAPQCPYATLEPNSNPDRLGNEPGALASQPGSDPGVLAVYFANFTTGAFGCPGGAVVPFSMTYAYARGLQSPTNDYNISPGLPNSAWKVPLSLGDCNVAYLAVGGGRSGLGVLEQDEAHGTTIYHRFDQTTMSFNTPRVTVANTKEQSPSLSQDSAGAIYATYLLSGPGSPIVFSYSANGLLWRGPGLLDPNTDQAASAVKSDVGPTGQGWVAWKDQGSVYAQQFAAPDSTPSPSAITTSQTAGKLTGASITIPASMTGETDQATLSGLNVVAAVGTVTYTLYSKPGCPASSVVSHSTVAVTAGHPAASAPVTSVLKPGTYNWQASYSGDFNNAPSISACAAEKLTVTPAVTVGGTATSTSKSVTVSVGCTSPPCTVTITVLVPGAHGKTIKLAVGTVTLRSKGSHRIKLKLTKPGRHYRKHHRRKLKAKIRVREKVHGHRLTITSPLTIKPLS